MTFARMLTPALAGIAAVLLIGWMLLTGGARTDSAEAYDVTTEQAAAKAGADVVPTDPRLTVEPAGYR